MIGRRSLVSMRSETGDVAALSAAAAQAGQDAAAAQDRADASMRVANTARSTANDLTAVVADLQTLAGTVESAMQASVTDRADLRIQLNSQIQQVNLLLGSIAGKASAESVSKVTADLSALATSVSQSAAQITTLGSQVAGKASQAGLDALTSSVAGKAAQSAVDALTSRVGAAESTLASTVAAVAGKASQAALNGLADSVGLLQAGLSSLAARVAVLEARPIVTVRRVRQADLPAIALLSSIDRTITWSSPMPSADYSIRPSIEGPAGLGQLQASVKSQTALGCVITVKAAVAVAANQVLDVVAIHV